MDPNNYFMNCGIFLNPAAAAQQPNMFMGLPPPPQQNVTAATTTNNNNKSAPAKKGRASKKSNLNLSDAEKVKKRLDANRIAARESRKRKKVLVEELQRSVRFPYIDVMLFCMYPFVCTRLLGAWGPMCTPLAKVDINYFYSYLVLLFVNPSQVIFFSRANNQLKQKNEELERMLLQAQSLIVSGKTGESSGGGGGEGESKVKTEGGGGPVKTEDDFGNPLILPDVAAPNNNDEGGGTAAEEDQSSTDVTLDKGLIDENTKTDAATTSSQQPNPEISTTLTPQQLTTTVLQHPIPLEWVPRTSGAPQPPPVGAPVAPMIDPSMYNMMMMTPGNPMMLANPMMALQVFQQMNNTVAAGVPAAPNNQLPQGAAAAAPTAAAVNPFPFMPPAMGNVIMPTPGGAFNPFLGAAAAANAAGQQQQTTSAPNPAPAAAATTAPTDGAASSSAGGGEASEDKILRSL